MGGDGLAAAAPTSGWTFLNNGTDYTFEHVSGVSGANPNNQQTIASTINAITPTVIGFASFYDDRTAFALNDRFRFLIADNSGAAPVDLVSADDVYPAQKINLIQQVLDDDGGAGVDASQFCNGAACGTVIQSGGYSASAPVAPMTLCALTAGANYLTGDLFRVLIYQSALTSTQRGINKAVDEWALGGTLPVTP